jgi:hypothetical protein
MVEKVVQEKEGVRLVLTHKEMPNRTRRDMRTLSSSTDYRCLPCQLGV